MTPANAGDASVASELIEDLLTAAAKKKATADSATDATDATDAATDDGPSVEVPAEIYDDIVADAEAAAAADAAEDLASDLRPPLSAR